MNSKVSKNKSQAASTPVEQVQLPEKVGVWQQTKDLASEAWLEFVKHSLIILPLIPLGLLMWLVEQCHVSVEVQSLLEFGEFFITLIQIGKLAGHLVPESKLKAITEVINRKTQSCEPNSHSSNAVGKVK